MRSAVDSFVTQHTTYAIIILLCLSHKLFRNHTRTHTHAHLRLCAPHMHINCFATSYTRSSTCGGVVKRVHKFVVVDVCAVQTRCCRRHSSKVLASAICSTLRRKCRVRAMSKWGCSVWVLQLVLTAAICVWGVLGSARLKIIIYETPNNTPRLAYTAHSSRKDK